MQHELSRGKKQGTKRLGISTQLCKVINYIKHSVEYIFSQQYSNTCCFWFPMTVSSFNNCRKIFMFKIYNGVWVLTYFPGNILIKVHGSDVQIIDGYYIYVALYCWGLSLNPYFPCGFSILRPSHPIEFLWVFYLWRGKNNDKIKRMT